jgi:putative serine protease PepD
MPPRTLLLSVAAAGLLGGAGGAAVYAGIADDPAASRPVSTPTATSARPVADTGALDAGTVYDRSKDAVAFISAGSATGTGFVITPDGYLVTNAHVVGEAGSVRVKIGDGRSQPARIVGIDRSTDVALLKVDSGGGELPTLEFGRSSAVEVGDAVVAIGNPYGLDRTLTTGVVSALERSITAPNGFSISNVVQTDAALNPGNSGGPLIDAHGRVIGINSQIETAAQGVDGQGANAGVGFAVPSDTVQRVVRQLRETGRATHAYLGVSLGDAVSDAGATVGGVTADGPAARAGLREGDVVTAVDGEAVEGSEDVTSAVDAQAPGDTVQLTVRRDGETRQVTVELGTRPASAQPAAMP